MDELAEQVYEVVTHYGIKRIIGFGVGAGANILCRFALVYPTKVGCGIQLLYPKMILEN